jgi:hypothetical protein
VSSLLKSTRSATAFDPAFKEFVTELRSLVKSPDGGKTASLAQILLLTMSIGFQKGVKGSPSPRSNDAVRLEYLDEPAVAQMRLVAVYDTKSSDVLEDDEMVIDIAEQYANGGLAILQSERESNPSFISWLERTLYQQTEVFYKEHLSAG